MIRKTKFTRSGFCNFWERVELLNGRNRTFNFFPWKPRVFISFPLTNGRSENESSGIPESKRILWACSENSWCWPKGARPLGTRMWKAESVDFFSVFLLYVSLFSQVKICQNKYDVLDCCICLCKTERYLKLWLKHLSVITSRHCNKPQYPDFVSSTQWFFIQ